MTYCPKCVIDGEEKRDGEVQWHRRCTLVVLGVLLVETAPLDGEFR